MRNLIIAVIALLSFTACNECSKTLCCSTNEDTSMVFGSPKMVDYLISLDREKSFTRYPSGYKWYETKITMKNFLDEETDGSVEEVTNIFQVVEGDSSCYDVHLYFFKHTAEGTTETVMSDFWVGNNALNDERILINYKKAFEIVSSVNSPKPHSREVVLQYPLESDYPEWVFGDAIYINAVTGDVEVFGEKEGEE